MNKKIVLSLIPALLLLCGCSPENVRNTEEKKSIKYEADWESLKKIPVPQWFDDVKLGIFIHWGPGSIREDNDIELPSDYGLKDYIHLFKAENWDPNEWADLFEQAGAHYVVLTAEHHRGWVQWDSDLTEWTSVKKGPKRDLVGDLATAVRAKGMRFSPSYHRERHNGYFCTRETRFLVEGTPRPEILKEIEEMPEAADLYGPFTLSDEFIADYVARWKELEEKYQPDFMWLDDVPVFYFADAEHPQSLKFKEAFKGMIADYMNVAAEWGKEVYLNNKGRTEPNFPLGVGCRSWDRVLMKELGPKWQCPLTMGEGWRYDREEEENDSYKSTTELVQILADVVSKNGNLLLNIGPRSDGTIPEGQRRRLLELGDWLKTNGDAIYGTRHWKVFGEDPEGFYEEVEEGEKPQSFGHRNIRFTTKDNAIYAIQLGWPSDGKMTLKSLSASSPLFDKKIQTISLVGTGEQLKWKQSNTSLEVFLPSEKHCEHALAVKIESE